MGVRDFFKKIGKRNEIIDLSDMPLRERRIYRAGSGGAGTVDLTDNREQSQDNSRTNQSGMENPFGFLGSLASASKSDSEQDSEIGGTDTAISSTSTTTILSHNQKTKLKGILRDMKNKIDSTYNRLYKLENRIDLIEQKIERLERRAGFSE